MTAKVVASELTVTLRPGITLPDWTIIGTSAARAALKTAFGAFDMGRKLAELTGAEDRIWRALLTLYGRTGKAPTTRLISDASGESDDDVPSVLRRLAARDLVLLNEDDQIVGAYPFTDRDTEHRIHAGPTVVGAMCAIDTLGMGAMLQVDTSIRSVCRHCRSPIEIMTRDDGRVLDSFLPRNALVWSGIRYGRCAADSLCAVQAFFCSESHLELWRSATEPGADGTRLSLDEALHLGRAIFEPVLKAVRP